MNLATQHVLVVGAILFCVGMVGFLTRRSLILMFLSLELMLAGVSVNFIAFSRQHNNYQGQVFAIFILTVAACEAAIALALIVALHREKSTLDVEQWRDLGERAPVPRMDPRSLPVDGQQTTYPTLTPAGLDPMVQPSPRTPSRELPATDGRERTGTPEVSAHV